MREQMGTPERRNSGGGQAAQHGPSTAKAERQAQTPDGMTGALHRSLRLRRP